MIPAISAMFIVLGTVILSLDLMLPYISVTTQQFLANHSVIWMLELMGIVFVVIGLAVIFIRISQTGIGMFLDLPNSRVVPLIHSRSQGKDPDASFVRGKRQDLEIIRVKNKIFKDAGGGFRIAGHGCRRTYETIGFTVPEWVSEYFAQVRRTYGIKNSKEYKQLRKALVNIKDGEPLDPQLRAIPLLAPIMNDQERRWELTKYTPKQIREMEVLLYDGVTHSGEEVENFIQTATPNEMDVLEHQTFINQMERMRRYRDKGDYSGLAKWAFPLVMLFLGAALAFMMIKGAS